jgi:hypothetical protein
MKIQINMDDPSKFEKELVVPEPGDYDVIIDNRIKSEKAKSSGNMICKVELAGHLEDGTAFKVFDNLVQTEESQWKFYQFFRSLGFTDEDIAAEIELDDTYQMPLRVKLKQEIYKGEAKAKVARYLYEKTA